MSGRFATFTRVGKFSPEDPGQFAREMARLEQNLARKFDSDDQASPYIITHDKKTATYNARPWEVVRVDPTAGAVAVILPAVTAAGVLGAWIGVKNGSASTNAIKVSAIGVTIDGAPTINMTTARQFKWFYATPDGWEAAS